MIAVAACPICFPKMALFGAFFGFGVLASFETAFYNGSQVLFLLAVAGHYLSYKKCEKSRIFVLALISTLLLFAGLFTATMWLMIYNRQRIAYKTKPDDQ
jgi:hypothetical protein